MPAFSIMLHAYNINKSYLSEKDLREESLISLTPRHNKFTNKDYKTACRELHKMMIEYNKGLRGGQLHKKYIKVNNENKDT